MGDPLYLNLSFLGRRTLLIPRASVARCLVYACLLALLLLLLIR